RHDRSALVRPDRRSRPHARRDARRRPRDGHLRPRLQVERRAVPHVDAGRVPGRADAGDGVHGVRDEDRRARRHLPRARDRELGLPVTLDNLAGFGCERPFFGVAMWVFMLGFLGFPLTGGFIGKFYVFAAAYRHGWWWLIVAGVIATIISAYYYLGVVRAMYFRDAAELRLAPAGGAPPREVLLGAGVAIR